MASRGPSLLQQRETKKKYATVFVNSECLYFMHTPLNVNVSVNVNETPFIDRASGERRVDDDQRDKEQAVKQKVREVDETIKVDGERIAIRN